MSAVIRVMIVDDHAVVREGIRTVLNGDPGLAVIAEAADGAQAVVLAGAEHPDVVLLDITMPGASGLDVVPGLLAAAPQARVLMLSVHDDTEYVLRAVRAGAHGYLRKDTTPVELRRAVRAVHEGGGFFSPSVAGHLTAALRGDAPALSAEDAAARQTVAGLTVREREVLALVSAGLLNKEIAVRLGISVRTVEAHRDNLGRKLGMRSVADLTRLAVAAGLVPAEPS